VSEPLDTVLPALAGYADDPAAAKARLVQEPPLPPFARQSFDPATDVRLRSCDADLAQALRASVQLSAVAKIALPMPVPVPVPEESDDDDTDSDNDSRNATQTKFFNAPLPAFTPPQQVVTLPNLLAFFRNPSRQLLQTRLSIRLAAGVDALEDDAAFVPDRNAQRALAMLVLSGRLQGTDLAQTC